MSFSLKRTGGVRACALACALAAAGVPAQDTPAPVPDATRAPVAASPADLAQLVAPIALYDDSLLADVLAASTYPVEVVEAARWLAQAGHAGLQGEALVQAMAPQNWDPGVQALVAFPQVLQMMNDRLDWTEHLGEAFLADPAAVMDAVQDLRRRSQDAGVLRPTDAQQVSDDQGVIVLAPPVGDVIAVPSYDPWCVYGPWPWPVPGPFYFGAWDGSCAPGDFIVGFGVGIVLPFVWWQWGTLDWHHHRLPVDPGAWAHFNGGQPPQGGAWRHDPVHRGGVPYADPRNARQFLPRQGADPASRGYAAPAQDARVPAAARREAPAAPPAFESFSPRHDVQMQSQRGASSRSGGSLPRQGGGGSSHGGGAGRGR